MGDGLSTLESIGAASASFWKSQVPTGAGEPLSLKTWGGDQDEFLEMALKSLNADSKVWAFETLESLHIYVSAKSSVKEDILDTKVWKSIMGPDSDSILQNGYYAQVDDKAVYIWFMQPKVSVFDLVKYLGTQAVRNLEGFQVSPPKQKLYWTPYLLDDDVTVGGVSLDDKIPF